MDIITHETIRSGQIRPYGDSITVVHFTSSPGTDDEAWEASKKLHTVTHRVKNRRQYGGACGFPHGLEPFADVEPLNKEKTQWKLTIIRPYCD